jgi:hypothetical protein
MFLTQIFNIGMQLLVMVQHLCTIFQIVKL